MDFLIGFVFTLAILALMSLAWDFARFSKARAGAPEGVLQVRGNRTYYRMPSGAWRKIADYAMDLSPTSPDMEMFSNLMDKARAEHEAEKIAKKDEAVKAMRLVAKESADA